MSAKKLKINAWEIIANDDDDGHLTLAIRHQDGTRVLRCEVDTSVNDEEWSDRFTTKRIEYEQYTKN